MKKKQKKKKIGRKSGPTMAERADRHALYEEAVQDAPTEVEFVSGTFQSVRGRPARLLREDFCGTANVACEWVRAHRENRAVGVDLSEEVLAWGREHHLSRLSPAQADRVELLCADVLDARSGPVDVNLAMNFSYWTFHTRDTLRNYFQRVRANLVDDGLFIMDVFGGHDAYKEMREHRDCDGFTYIWDQARYDPVTGRYTCHIHFRFPDKSRINEAFTYEWRLWSLPELREVLEEAGFSDSTVYWQGTDEETGEGNGEFDPVEHGEADPAWIAYIVAEK
jgi:SAM-dependent methyltransferase